MLFYKKYIIIYVISVLILLTASGYIYFFSKSHSDISGSNNSPEETYSLGMMQPFAPPPDKNPVNIIQLFDDLRLTNVRYLLYPLPEKGENNLPIPNPDQSFPRSDKFIKFANARQEDIIVTLYLNANGRNFTPDCQGSGDKLQCNFDWKNLIPDIIHRLDGDCDFNNDGDCTDIIYGQKESNGPIGKVTTYQILSRLPNTPIFREEEGAARYAALFKEIANKIKRECPTCKIVFPSLTAARDDIYPFDITLDARALYLKNVFNYLGQDKKLINAFDIQFRGMTDQRYYAYQRIQEMYYRYIPILEQAGLDNIPIWMTEVSAYNEQPQKPWDSSQTFVKRDEKDQANGLIREVMYGYALGIKKIFSAPLVDKAQQVINGETINPCDTYFCHSGLLNEDGTVKTVYKAFKFMREQIIPNAQEMILIRDDNIKIIGIQYPDNKKAFVAWNDAGTETINIDCVFHTKVKITNIITAKTSTAYTASIQIGEEPLFIMQN